MSAKIFSSSVRELAHAKLEEVLATGDLPGAECREDGDEYSVWSGAANDDIVDEIIAKMERRFELKKRARR